MRTEILVVALLAALSAPLQGQFVQVGPRTQIRSVDVDLDENVVGRDRLLDHIAARGRGGAVGLRRALRWIPFVPGVEERYFDPVELQRDRERIRRLLDEVGYPRATVDYDVSLDDEEDVVDIVFLVDPGDPLIVERLEVAWQNSGRTDLDASEALGDIGPGLALRQGDPLDRAALRPAAAALGRWLGDRGHAFARIETVTEVDSAALTARVTLEADAGPRARIGEISVEGNADLRTSSVRRFLEVETGDWFSLERLRAAGDRIASLDIVRSASFELSPGQPRSDVVDLVLRIREADQRTVSAQAGYATDGGLSGDATWTHRNIFLGGQTLTGSISGQSGIFALDQTPDKFIRASLAFRQPIRGRARLTLNVGPFVEFRNDYRDRSLAAGGEATLLYQIGPLSSVALRYALSTRRIFEYRFGDISRGIGFFELLDAAADQLLDEFGARLSSSVLSLSATFGSLDVPTEPTRGFLIEPALSVSAPGSFSSTEYFKASIRTSGYLPLGRSFTLAGRLGGGRVFPFGKSVPDTISDGLRKYIQLRDVLFTGGGMTDVRGWAERQLGPKFPRAIIRQDSDSTIAFDANRYTPIGGFNKAFATVELRGPMPFLGQPWNAHAFLDAGRVWTRDERFTSPDDPEGFERLFWGTGIGIDYATPVGSIRIAVGYKLNPSVLDLVDPDDLLQAIVTSTPFDQLERHRLRRFQLHIGIGRRL